MYEYLLLLTASWLAYRGAPASVIILVGLLLSLPRVVRDHTAGELSLTTAVLTANAIIFATAAYFTGVGIALLLAS